MVTLKRTGKTLSKKTAKLEYFNGFHSVVRGSDDCIEVLNGMVGFAGGMMTGGITLFAILAYIFIAIHPEGGRGVDIIWTGFTILGTAVFSLGVTCIPYFTIPHTPSPIRFNQKTREIYIMQEDLPKENKKRELMRFDWDKADFRRELAVVPSGGGPPRMEHKTFFIATDLNDEIGKEHKILIGTGTTLEEDQETLWEYIRRFMENEEILVKLKDKEGKETIRKPTDREQFIGIDEMLEYLPFWEQLKSKLRFNFLYPYAGTVIPRLKGYNPELNMGSTLGNIMQFIYYQLKFLVLLVYPFFAIVAIPAMFISSWAYGTKPINNFPEENNTLCGLSPLKDYIKQLVKNDGKALETEAKPE